MKSNFIFNRIRSKEIVRRFLRHIKKIQHWWKMAQIVTWTCSRFITSADYRAILKSAHEFGIGLQPEITELPSDRGQAFSVKLPGEPAQKVFAAPGGGYKCLCHESLGSSRTPLERTCRHTEAVATWGSSELAQTGYRQLSLL